MKRFIALCMASAVAFGSVSVDTKKRIKEYLSKWGVRIEKINNLGSLYEVVVKGDPKVIYFTKDLKYMILGGVFDPKTGKNITANRIREITKVNVARLNTLPHLQVSYGSGPELYVFVDTDCPYCRKFLSWAKSKGVVLHIFFFPVHSYNKNLYALCRGLSGDAKEIVEAMIRGDIPEQDKDAQLALCESTLKQHIKEARKLGIRGTPFIITREGKVIQGFMPQLLEQEVRNGQ